MNLKKRNIFLCLINSSKQTKDKNVQKNENFLILSQFVDNFSFLEWTRPSGFFDYSKGTWKILINSQANYTFQSLKFILFKCYNFYVIQFETSRENQSNQ